MKNCSISGVHDFNMASRKAEEAAWRRYEATQWLESQVGPLGISKQPTERELVSCLRNGLILCKAINKIHPGAIPKVVDTQVPLQPLTWDSQPLPAYQYFENVRNFLVAASELKLPAFEASDLERESVENGSAGKIVDCILSLKWFHESKQMNNQSGSSKHMKSPLVMQAVSRMQQRATAALPSDACRRLDLSATLKKMPPAESNFKKSEETVESLVKILVDRLLDAKENIDEKLVDSLCIGDQDPLYLFNQILTSCCGEQPSMKSPELPLQIKDFKKEESSLSPHFSSKVTESDAVIARENSKCYKACLGKCICNHKHLIDRQKKELQDLKALKFDIKNEFEEMQSQFQKFFSDIGRQVNEMSTNALGYHKVVEENRKLYNMVQDLKGNIRVYCRIRPAFRAESKNVVDFIGEDGSLFILDPLKTGKDGRKLFQFNRIFGPTTGQDEVYRDTQPLIRSVMDGYNVCIFAYGQTGSGKTHTMSGPTGGTSKDMGINYLALNDLFQMSSVRKENIKYDIHVQMVEIYNEQVRDLLTEDKTENKLEIRSCNDDGMNLPDATLQSVKSTADVMTLMKLGEVNRAVSSTAINDRSSRSHSVLTVHVNGKDTSGNSIRSCLHLVDLAGSERVDKSEVTGDRLKEALYINKSLSCLGDVITALAQKNSHIPYRNSKLTLLLQDSLGGQAKTLMFAHMSPEADSFGETVSTLKFAQRVSTVELGAARMNKESSEVMQLRAEVENLKIALVNKENSKLMHNRTKETYTSLEKTPLRPRRLSIESCSTIKTDKPVKVEDKSGVKSPFYIHRSRRLSLEGPRTNKKASAEVNKTLQYEPMYQLQYRPQQDQEAVSKLNDQLINGDSGSELHADSGVQIHPLQLPQTPEPQLLDKTDSNRIVSSDLADSITTKVIGSTNGKWSQLRSLRTTGKLINDPDKRSQQIMVEVKSPIKGNIHANQIKTPLAASERTKRRRSLTGITSGSNNLRRSSLEGKPVPVADPTMVEVNSPVKGNIHANKYPLVASERPKRRQSLTGIPSGSNKPRRYSLEGKPAPVAYEERNTSTPPPVHSESKTLKRWL